MTPDSISSLAGMLSAAPYWAQATAATLAGAGAAVGLPVLIEWRRLQRARRILQTNPHELRVPAYEAVRRFVAGIVERGTLELAALQEFDQRTRRAELVFDRSIASYLDQLRERAFEVYRMRALIIGSAAGALRPKAKERYAELMDWFARERAALDRRFAPFLEPASSPRG